MQKKYTLSGSVPSKKNSRINTRSGRSFPSKAFTEWHKQAELELQAQGIQSFKKPVRIHADFFFENNIRRDLDNRVTSVLDLFTDLGILEDDRWQCVPEIKITGQLDKGNPHAVIEIKEL